METTLYSKLATEIITRIENGSYRIGEKIPSIRNYALQSGSSVNTVKEAYSLLERRRYIVCKPQSGYFVDRAPPPLPAGPELHPERLDPLEVPFCRIYNELKSIKAASGIADLGIAVPGADLLPMRKIASAFRDCLAGIEREGRAALAVEYMISPGYLPLREEVARIMTESGCAARPDDVVITSGASEAVSLALLALCRRGDAIAVESPIYFNFLNLAKELGIRVLEIPSSPTEGMSVEALRFALEHHRVAACLSIPTFSNPTGSLMPEERKRELVALCEAKGVPLIEDDVHGDLPFFRPRPRSLKSFDKSGIVVYCSSFSKTLGSGIRLGWTEPGRFREAIERLKLLTSIGTSSLTQLAVAGLLSRGGYERHVRALSRALQERLTAMSDCIACSFPAGTRVTRPQGGLLLWAELPGGRSSLELYELAAAEGILFSPGPTFSPSRAFGSCLRLNAGHWDALSEKAVRRLGAIASGLGLSATG